MSINFQDSYPIVQWDLNKKTLFKHFIGSVDDSANGYKLQILQGSDVLIPSTEEVYFYFEKKDNTHGYIKANNVDDFFVIDLSNQVFAVAGNVSCNFQITSGLKWKTSPEFTIKVDDNNIQDSIESSDDFIAFQNALNSMITVVQSAEDAIVNVNAATNTSISTNTTVQNAETIRVANEEDRKENEIDRVAKDAVRPVWHYLTQLQYDSLPDIDKNNPLNVYQITDNQDSTLGGELTTLLTNINSALTAVQAITDDINNINDTNVSVSQAWSSDKIINLMRTATYTATSTTSTITHNLTYNPNYDDMIVTYNGIVLEKGINYTDNPTYVSIALSGWTISSGDTIKFRLYKYAKY